MSTIFQTLQQAVMEAGNALKTGDASVIQVKGPGGNYVTRDDFTSREILIRKIRREHPDAVIFTEEGDDDGTVSEATWRDIPDLTITDELDGTTNNAIGLPLSAVMAAHYKHGVANSAVIFDRNTNGVYSCESTPNGWKMSVNGQPVIRRKISNLMDAVIGINYGYDDAPARNITLLPKLFGCVASVRMLGCAGIDALCLAQGIFHGYIGAGFSPFDLGALLTFLKAAGIKAETTDGREATIWDTDFIAGAPEIFEAFKEVIKN